MRMGRKRSMLAFMNGLFGRLTGVDAGGGRKSTIMMAVLLNTIPHQHEHADKREERRFFLRNTYKGQQSSYEAQWGSVEEYCQG